MMITFAIVWLAAACAVVGLAAYRKLVSHFEEDDELHLRDADAAVITHQVSVARRLDSVDKWGKTLTIAIVIFGILLAAAYLYQQWVLSNQIVAH